MKNLKNVRKGLVYYDTFRIDIVQFRQEILDVLVILTIFWTLKATANAFDFRFKSYISIGLLQGIQTLVRLPPIYLEQFTV